MFKCEQMNSNFKEMKEDFEFNLSEKEKESYHYIQELNKSGIDNLKDVIDFNKNNTT